MTCVFDTLVLVLVLATSWEQGSCTNIDYLSIPHQMSVNVTQVKESQVSVILSWNLFLCSHDSILLNKQMCDYCGGGGGAIGIIW
jgi:hypothetical protein